MKSQLITDHIHVQMETHAPDLSDLLRDIRAQYDLAAKRNREESEEWYSSKVRKELLLDETVNDIRLAIIKYF